MRKQEEGRTALLKAARQSPARYIAVAAALRPQHFKVEHELAIVSSNFALNSSRGRAKLLDSGVPDLLALPRENGPFSGYFRSSAGWSHGRAATITSRRHLPQPSRAKKSRDCRGGTLAYWIGLG